MPKRDSENRVPAAARAFAALQGEDATLAGGGPSPRRRAGATVLALLVFAAFPLYLAANATGLIGDSPAALAKGPNSGPGSNGDDDDDSSGPGPGARGDEDDDTGTHTRTGARAATDDTSRPGHSTRGTTRDNDTRTNSNTHTRTRGQTQTRTQGQTQTRTRTGR